MHVIKIITCSLTADRQFCLHVIVQSRRWAEEYDDRMSEVLPNYEVVLTRIANKPSKPCVKPPKKKKMRTVPSPATIRRLAENKPL